MEEGAVLRPTRMPYWRADYVACIALRSIALR